MTTYCPMCLRTGMPPFSLCHSFVFDAMLKYPNRSQLKLKKKGIYFSSQPKARINHYGTMKLEES